MKRAIAIVTLSFVGLVSGCGGCSGPGDPGDSCNPNADEPCETGLVCAPDVDAEDVCQVPLGGECDPGAEEPFCLLGTGCFEDAASKEGGLCFVVAGGACDPTIAEEQCAPDLSCVEIQGGDDPFACFPPVLIVGIVFDAITDVGIGDAHVIALDERSTAVSDVAVSAEDGSYALEVPTVRDVDGAPLAASYTLRASAADYQTFPGGIRTALPIFATDAVAMDAGWIIDTPPTDIALIVLPAAGQGNASISGTVLSDVLSAGVLVVAEAGGVGYSAVTDAAGDYTIFNVPDGALTVRGYAAGVQLQPVDVTVVGSDLTDVDLVKSAEILGTISGSINIVNAPGGAATSVVLVVASTFSSTFVRGEVPPGLRTPLIGPPDVTGAWTIDEVPSGSYVVLAAFENDDLVRDPDPNIAGTQIVTVTMPDPTDGTSIMLTDAFKVTEALAVISPGADLPEGVTDPPPLRWADDSGEDLYEVVVYDALGNLVWGDLMIPSVSGNPEVSVVYGGPPLDPGMYYQFRATSVRTMGGSPGPISTTEDLRGVFFLE